MAYPSRHVAELVRLTRPHGIEYEGIGGGGHARFRLPTGEVYSTSASPSDRYATDAAWSDIAKKLGIPLGKIQSGKYRKGLTRQRAQPRSAPRATSARANDLREYIRSCERVPNLNEHAAAGLRRARSELADLDRAARNT